MRVAAVLASALLGCGTAPGREDHRETRDPGVPRQQEALETQGFPKGGGPTAAAPSIAAPEARVGPVISQVPALARPPRSGAPSVGAPQPQGQDERRRQDSREAATPMPMPTPSPEPTTTPDPKPGMHPGVIQPTSRPGGEGGNNGGPADFQSAQPLPGFTPHPPPG